MWKLVCIGWWRIPKIKNWVEQPYETKEIDEEIVKLSKKDNPQVLFIGTAHYDSYNYYLGIKKVFEKLWCNVLNLDLEKENIKNDEIKDKILGSDIIYVGHWDTKFMLEKWKEFGVDKMLIEAYNKWIVCSGSSAWSYCRFKINYDKIIWLWLIDAVNCVHYEEKDDEAKKKFYNVIKETWLDWIALENCVAIEFIDGTTKIIKSNKSKNAYKITYENGKFIEELLE